MRPHAFILGAVAALTMGPVALGQNCISMIWCDFFDTYAPDTYIVGQDVVFDGCMQDPFTPPSEEGRRWIGWNGTYPPNEPSAQSLVVVDPQDPQEGRCLAVEEPESLVYELFGDDFDAWITPDKVYKLSGLIYVPLDFADAEEGNWYLQLLNTYEPDPAEPRKVSTRLRFDASTGTMVSEPEGDELTFRTDSWMSFAIIIDLAGDHQTIKLDTDGDGDFQDYEQIHKQVRGWTYGVDANGAKDIAALHFTTLDSPAPIFVDGLFLCEISGAGACCLGGGPQHCVDGIDEQQCHAQGGFFEGIGTECASIECFPRVDTGWMLPPYVFPLHWEGDLELYDDCDVFGGPDDTWTIELPWDQKWFFEVCETEADTVLALGTEPCDEDLAFNDDNPLECGQGSLGPAFRVELEADATYYLTLEAWDIGGPYAMSIDAQCPRLEPTPGATPEPEPCGDNTNGGCNFELPDYMPIVCGETYRGTLWYDDGTRDTDWYVIEVSEDTEVTLTGESVFADAIFAVVEDSDTQDCDLVGFRFPLGRTGDCRADDRRAVVTTVLEHTDRDGGDPNTTKWWLFVAPSFGGPIWGCDADDPDGQNGYTLLVECGPAVDPCPWDFDDSEEVDFQDLLTVLAGWGPCPDPCPPSCAQDLNGDCIVGFDDLLTLLANWGECPSG